MSRERPSEPPRAVPDAQRGRVKQLKPHQVREHAELERLKAMHGSGFFGSVAGFFQDSAPRVSFIRRGYEASIRDNLKDFYAARPRPWRPATHDSCKPTHKERLKAQRRKACL